MATVITINRADVVALVEEAAAKFTHGNKTEESLWPCAACSTRKREQGLSLELIPGQ